MLRQVRRSSHWPRGCGDLMAGAKNSTDGHTTNRLSLWAMGAPNVLRPVYQASNPDTVRASDHLPLFRDNPPGHETLGSNSGGGAAWSRSTTESIGRIEGNVRTHRRGNTRPASGPRRSLAAATGSEVAHRSDELRQGVPSVAKQHRRVLFVEQIVVDPREARTHAALENDDVVGAVHVEYGHTVDRTA